MVFDTIAKWWCQCIDQFFHLVARPWRDEELPYRRMLSVVFEVPWRLPRAYDEFLKWNDGYQLAGWNTTRDRLQEFTRFYWDRNRDFVTPSWPNGATALLEEIFSEWMKNFDPTTVKAIRMLYGLKCARIPKHLIPRTLGVEAKKLYIDIGKAEKYDDGCLQTAPHFHLFQRADFQSELNRFFWEWYNGKRAEEERKRTEMNLSHRQVEINELFDTLPESLLNRTIEDTVEFMSVRSYNALHNKGLKTIRAILEASEVDILRGPNFGRKSLNEINELLKSMDERLYVGCLSIDHVTATVDEE